jgi:hypothetical protein
MAGMSNSFCFASHQDVPVTWILPMLNQFDCGIECGEARVRPFQSFAVECLPRPEFHSLYDD